MWARLAPLPPPRKPGRPRKDDRLLVNGIVWKLATGAPGRDLPDRYGPWQTVYTRFRRWTLAGEWDRILAAVQRQAGAALYHDPAGTAWTVIMEPDPAFAVSCLNRLVYVKPLVDITGLGRHLAAVRPYLQSVGVAGDHAFQLAVADVADGLGAARICPLGQMQHPPADWRHDGRPRLLDLLRWVDLEQSIPQQLTEAAASRSRRPHGHTSRDSRPDRPAALVCQL